MEGYAGKQFVGIDLHRRRSVIVRTTVEGDVLETVRIVNDVDQLTDVMSRAGECPEVWQSPETVETPFSGSRPVLCAARGGGQASLPARSLRGAQPLPGHDRYVTGIPGLCGERRTANFALGFVESALS